MISSKILNSKLFFPKQDCPSRFGKNQETITTPKFKHTNVFHLFVVVRFNYCYICL